ncbi:MAG: GAF domain-containing sensor histidine kinase [Anaerolineales bacterium]|nr:GAF domain-containing sensor histidine kinase [Anaerolineales bacterium]
MQLITHPMDNYQAQSHELAEWLQSIQNAQTTDSLWNALSQTLQMVLGCKKTAVYLKNLTTATVTCPYANGLTDHMRDVFAETMRSYAAVNPDLVFSPVVVSDVHQIPDEQLIKRTLIEEMIDAYMLIFFTTFDSWGMVALLGDNATLFSPNEVNTGQAIVELAVANLKNQQMQQKLAAARVRELRRNEITQTLNQAFDLPTILQSICRIATELIYADGGVLGLVVDNQIMIFYPYNVPAKMNLRPAMRGRGVAWQIVESAQPVLLTDYGTHPQAQIKWVKNDIKAFLGVPIIGNDECLGAICLFDTSPERQFTREEMDLIESVGRQAGMAIQNSRMLAEVEQRASALANSLSRQEELDKLKNQFIHAVSHELRTPLGIIYGHAELLESGDLGELTLVQQNSVQIVLRRIRMLTDMVEDLTALMAAETQEFRRDFINPLQLVYSMLAEYRMQAEDLDLTLQAELAESLPWLHGDLTHLRRVFDNLFSNAFKYTPAGGSVTLRMFVEGEKIIIEVADTGEGIEAQHLPRIFERFYQVTDEQYRPRRKGTGLGLALVKEIVEAHRGEVYVESELGVGTTFRIELPGHVNPEGEGVTKGQLV